MNRTVLQFKITIFGFLTALQVLTRVFMQISTWVHQWGSCTLGYLNDWLVIADSLSCALEYYHLLQLYHDWKLSLIRRSQTSLQNIGLSTLKWWWTLSMILDHQISRCSIYYPLTLCTPLVKLWQQLLGYMASLEHFVQHGMLRMHPLQW